MNKEVKENIKANIQDAHICKCQFIHILYQTFQSPIIFLLSSSVINKRKVKTLIKLADSLRSLQANMLDVRANIFLNVQIIYNKLESSN